jgi:hydrogenase-4 component J
MAERAVFYRLTHKFVNQEMETQTGSHSEAPRQVIFYSLAIGHHVGVMDCFQSLLEIPLEDYRQWVARLPEGPGCRKLEGLLAWGEIEINRSHAGDLLKALRSSLQEMDASQRRWSGILSQCLQEMVAEPALYLMVRKRP